MARAGTALACLCALACSPNPRAPSRTQNLAPPLITDTVAAKPAPVAATPPKPEPPPRSPPPKGLVDVPAPQSGLRLDLRYASANNFTGATVPGYETQRLWLHPDAANALEKVRTAALARGYGLVVYDAYRPARATKAFVTFAKQAGHPEWITDGYISRRSAHNRGLAIDLSLFSLDSGAEVDMGCAFDSFDERAHTAHADGEALTNRHELRELMMDAGFAPYAKEWWHFVVSLPEAPEFDAPIRD